MRPHTPKGCELADEVTDRARIRAWVDAPVALVDGAEAAARIITFRGLVDSAEHIAVGLGSFRQQAVGIPLVRIHSECLTGDVFRSRRCDCGPQLEESMQRISVKGGYVLYLRQEGRGIGLYSKVDAYRLQDQGLDTFTANRSLGFEDDPRNYRVASEMLMALGVSQVDLLTGNPAKVRQLSEYGIRVRNIVATDMHMTTENLRYLEAKATRGHVFNAAYKQSSTCEGG